MEKKEEKIEIELSNLDSIDNNSTPDTRKDIDEMLQKKFDIKNFLISNKRVVIPVGIILVFFLIGTLVFFTDLKYPVLGTLLKSEIELSIVDSKTQFPVPDAKVLLDGKEKQTDKNGYVKYSKINIGNRPIEVVKNEYVSYKGTIFVRQGANRVETVSLVSSINFAYFSVKNAISDQYIEDATVELEGAPAKTDKDGIAKIKINKDESGQKNIRVAKEGFIDSTSTIALSNDSKVNTVRLVPEGKHYLLSNRRGKVDLYESNLDGSEQKIMLEATGLEDMGTFITTSQNNQWIALSSTREGIRSSSGNLLSQLYLINSKDKSINKLKTESTFNILGWSGNNLVFTTENSNFGQNQTDQKMTLWVYNVNTRQYLDAVAATTLYARLIGDNVVIGINDREKSTENGLYYLKVGDITKKEIIKEVAFQVFVNDETNITFSTTVSDAWYTYNFRDNKLNRLTGVPPVIIDKELSSSPDKTKFVFLETRDGRTDLYLREKGKDTKLTNIGAATWPVRWIGNEYVQFKVIREGETADYVVSISGGSPQKIADVFAVKFGSNF